MFGLFKKKEKPAQSKPVSAEGEEFRALAAQFESEEFTMLAVIGPGGFSAGRREGDQLYTAGAGVTAWLEEGQDGVHQGDFRLMTKADDTLRAYLSRTLPRDFIVKCRVRPHRDGQLFLLTNLPEPAFDPELKAILEQQKKPVTEQLEGVGTFVLNRTVGVFQAEARWGEETVQLCYEQTADREACAAAARALMGQAGKWDGQARACAADELLAQAQELAAEFDEQLEREEFMARLIPDAIDLTGGEQPVMWYADDGMLAGGSIRITGTLTDGPARAELERVEE